MATDITRSMVEIAVDKTLRDMARDPERSIRNLVDLGESFTRGRFQTYLFQTVQHMLKDRHSAYYALGKNIISKIQHRAIKRFGLNLGYNGFTSGARTIRRLEAQRGFNIPWVLSFHYEEQGDVTLEDLDQAIRSGRELGIYSYFFFVRGSSAAKLTPMLAKYPDCAFVVFLVAHTISEYPLDAPRLDHMILALPAQDEQFDPACKALREERALFAAYISYGEDDAQEILSEAWEQRAAGSGAVFALSIARGDCPDEMHERVVRHILAARDAQRVPVFLMDYYADLIYIDRVISDQPCYLGVYPDGRIVTIDGIAPDIRFTDAPLETVLQKTMPRVE